MAAERSPRQALSEQVLPFGGREGSCVSPFSKQECSSISLSSHCFFQGHTYFCIRVQLITTFCTLRMVKLYIFGWINHHALVRTESSHVILTVFFLTSAEER